MVYGAAHSHIAERLLVHVHGQVADVHAGLRQELEIGVGADRLNVLGAEVVEAVDRALRKFQEAHRGFLNRFEN